MTSKPKLAHSAEKLKDSSEHIKDSAAHVKDSTSRMEGSTERMEYSADRRTELSANRTLFAAERTYAAWVRTGLVALASGVGAKTLLGGTLPSWLIVTTGTVLVLFSVFCFWAAVWRNLNSGASPPRPDVARIHPALLIIVNGLLALASLASLIGIWFGRAVL